MAATRSTQSRKRVQQIVDDAAEKIAAESDLEEEVVVVVEELPPGETARRRRTAAAPEAATTTPVIEMPAGMPAGMVAQAQDFLAATIDRWTETMSIFAASGSSSMVPFGGFLDPRQTTEETFRLAEGVLAAQKDFALRIVDSMERARAA